jgi:hypothetical protein
MRGVLTLVPKADGMKSGADLLSEHLDKRGYPLTGRGDAEQSLRSL